MKKASVAVFAVLGVFTFIAATVIKGRLPAAPMSITKDVVGCAPSATEDIILNATGKYIPVLPGWGNYSYKISTTSDSAQFYFNQGINLYYGYHMKQALASFKEAARFDENCAMAYWGQALSLGPYYNAFTYTMRPQLPAVLQLLNTHYTNAGEKEKQLIGAMQQRYSADVTNADRAQLDQNYAAQLASLAKAYPQDNDIKALYIDAVMLQHKWDFWHKTGEPKSWTPELITLCQTILDREPMHPAALHYYIHITEASRHPEVAINSANVLKDLMPGTSHMVHMASHMYQRTGQFTDGVYVNEAANTASNIADSLSPETGVGQNSQLHYFAVQSYCAINAGMYDKARSIYQRTSRRAADMLASDDNQTYQQYLYMLPTMAAVRMGKWNDILQALPVNSKWTYAVVLENFARGMALVHKKDYPAATVLLKRIEDSFNDELLSKRRMPFNAPLQGCRIAAGILKGELLRAQGKNEEAIAAFNTAIAQEDELVYSEPQDWVLPARQYLGNLLYKMNRTREAEQIYRDDLAHHPGNGWSLLGLQQCLTRQNKKKEAAQYKASFQKAFKDGDVIPTSPVF